MVASSWGNAIDTAQQPYLVSAAELESQLSNLERDLSNVNTNYVALRKNHLELLELKNVLQKSETFLSETNLQIADGGGSSEESRSECVSVFRTQF